MTKNQTLTLIFIGIIIAVVIIFMALGGDGNGPLGETETGDQLEGESSLTTETYSPEVPEVELTEPVSQVSAAPGVEAQLRTFNMNISSSGYSPNELVVNQGDTIDITLTSSGGEYDITLPDLGLYQKVGPDERKKLSFQALTPGTFTFECRDLCPSSEINGRLIVRSTE